VRALFVKNKVHFSHVRNNYADRQVLLYSLSLCCKKSVQCYWTYTL